MRIRTDNTYARRRVRANPMLHWLQKFLGRPPATAGGRGEQLAAAWLQRERGFTIVARNWRSPRDRRDELDLVARDGEALVFVEVKTRGADALVPGFNASSFAAVSWNFFSLVLSAPQSVGE